ncbi:hypothetical protein [Limnohabitans sp. 63ED37-2]|uniref:hypothetical protein n=1 Tax=Limnohabitans sp. 63ED37-2 TaxID=1678128 RepID=UPI000705E8B4|nr:hypothetical protein [Limnohabitans sp. 63ED37-2]ALK90330.1 hypothetical protein L63ED372_03137 [Limnohabitans sp. 63ED37-2]
MSKTTNAAKINTITACFSGSGVQAYAYFVDDNFMRKYEIKISDSGSDLTTPFETSEILDDATAICKFICHGMHEDPSIAIKFNGKAIQVESLEIDDPFEDETHDVESALLMRYAENQDHDFMVPEGMHLLVEVVEYDDGELITELQTTDKMVELKDFLLEVRDLDTSSDLSEATYMTGLLNGAEYDILNLQYKGEPASFELNFSGICGGGLYLVKPDSQGIWRDYYEIKTSEDE